MAAPFHFERILPFCPQEAETTADTLRTLPAAPGVLALFGPDPAAQPYLTRAADLRRRITRILAPPDSPSSIASKRLNLRDRVARIAYTITGSDFESTLTLYHAAYAIYGPAEARRRLKLHTPYFLRLTLENQHPRVYTTNRLSRRSLAQMYGPFPSRLAAERYCDAVLDLFKLRRCHEDLAPFPEHPGCVYQEMKKCLAPCNLACTPEQYASETAAVKAFFDTGGVSMLSTISAEREQASANMEFEKAASLHTQWQKVKAVAALADEIVRPIPTLRAIVVQPLAVQPAAVQSAAAHPEAAASEAAVFLLDSGALTGPARLSTLGVRAVKEQTSVGSSLFAQPLMLQAVPLADKGSTAVAAIADSPEARAERTIATLTAALAEDRTRAVDTALLSDHLSLFRRWYYRPDKQRTGEIFLANPDASWPVRRILRGAARMVLGDPAPMAETQREAVKTTKVRILHQGRPDVERAVPVIARPAPGTETPETFTSRRAHPDPRLGH